MVSGLNKIYIKHSHANVCKNENNKLLKASTEFNVIHPWDKDLTTKKKRKRNTNKVQAKNKYNSITPTILTTKQPNCNVCFIIFIIIIDIFIFYI